MDPVILKYTISGALLACALPVSVMMGLATLGREATLSAIVMGCIVKGLLLGGVLAAMWQVNEAPPAHTDLIALGMGIILVELLRVLLRRKGGKAPRKI